MTKIFDSRDICAWPGHEIRYRSLSDLRYLMLHRIDPRQLHVEDTAEAVARWFRVHERWTMPYTFFIRRDGTIEQTRSLDEMSPHAYTQNRYALAVGLSGDFRHSGPTFEQEHSLHWLAPLLVQWLGLEIVGHTDVEGATSDPDKVCPGWHLDVADIAETIRREARLELGTAGLSLG